MRKLTILAALLLSSSAMAAEYARYDCRVASGFDNASISAPFHGCSIWYPQSTWDSRAAKRVAVDAARQACLAEIGEETCYLLGCHVDLVDETQLTSECPAN